MGPIYDSQPCGDPCLVNQLSDKRWDGVVGERYSCLLAGAGGTWGNVEKVLRKNLLAKRMNGDM